MVIYHEYNPDQPKKITFEKLYDNICDVTYGNVTRANYDTIVTILNMINEYNENHNYTFKPDNFFHEEALDMIKIGSIIADEDFTIDIIDNYLDKYGENNKNDIDDEEDNIKLICNIQNEVYGLHYLLNGLKYLSNDDNTNNICNDLIGKYKDIRSTLEKLFINNEKHNFSENLNDLKENILLIIKIESLCNVEHDKEYLLNTLIELSKNFKKLKIN
jgi:hypothetical protein